MTQIPFDPNANILIFRCRVEYESIITLYLALDTGASNVIISREAAINIGYNLKLTPDQTTISDASTSHLVPILTLKSFRLADATVENIQVLCYTIPEELGINGVIGLNFLRHFNVNLNFEKGILTLNRIRKNFA